MVRKGRKSEEKERETECVQPNENIHCPKCIQPYPINFLCVDLNIKILTG